MIIKFKPFQVERPWGYFRQFSENTPVTVKIIVVKPHEILSLQSHTKREEFWHVISGQGMAEIGNDKRVIKTGAEMTIPLGIKHRVKAGAKGLEVMEISSGKFDESDVIHYEDKYGRI